MGRQFESILDTVGRTPVVKINRLAPSKVDLYVKIEAFNPLGSVKDRLALGVIEAAESSDTSAGATFAGALKVAAEADKGATILCMLPDTAERYLSTPLFADIPADMTPEEMAIARSTPSAQMP